MSIAKYDERNLPEYLLGENISELGEQLFVVRCHAPRCIGLVDELPTGELSITDFEWFDPVEPDPVKTARLMREMGDWLHNELEEQCDE